MTIELELPFGLPPKTFVSDAVMEGSMPTATIVPHRPSFTSGINVFTIKEAKGEYIELLRAHGFSLPNDRGELKVAFLADNFPTDAFQNEYAESFLDKFAQVASTGMADLNQFFGSDTLSDTFKKGIGILGEDSMIGGFMKTASDQAKTTMAKLESSSKAGSAAATKLLKAANAVAAGARVDFPQVWRNSSFQPSYTMTVRLYNPNPASITSTRKYIVGPVAALLLLGLPRAAQADNSSYQFPFLHTVRAEGIYNLSAAAITGINVIKGGDQQSIAFNQSLGVVDVRLDFGSIYNSILSEHKDSVGSNSVRPTLYNYLEGIGGTSGSGNGKGFRDVDQDMFYRTPSLAAAPTTTETTTYLASTGNVRSVTPKDSVQPNAATTDRSSQTSKNNEEICLNTAAPGIYPDEGTA